MFGKKKKEEAKRLAEQQPLAPVEDEMLEAEIISDGELEEVDMISFGGVSDTVAPAVESASLATPADDIADLGLEEAEEAPAEELVPEIEEATEAPVEEAVEAPEEIAEEAEEAPAEEPAEAPEEVPEETAEEAEEEPAEEDSEESEEAPADEAPAEEQQEEVVYVVDGPEEDDEIVKPAQFVKLPHLVDYLLSSDPKPSKKYLLKYAMKLTDLYSKAQTEDDKKIIKSCILKIANAMRK